MVKDHVPGNNFEMSHIKIEHAENKLCIKDAKFFEHATNYSVLFNPSEEKRISAAEHEKELE